MWTSTARTRPSLDTPSNVENAAGTAFDDTLTGDGKDNFGWSVASGWILGGGGNDWLDGGVGNDVLDGGSGIDTVSYESALAGVTADLVAGKASPAAAEDILSGIENLVGGIFTGQADRQ